MESESNDEDRLIVRVQTTVYRQDWPELWELLHKVPAKRRGAALMAAAFRALAFEQAARALSNANAQPPVDAAAQAVTSASAPPHAEGPAAVHARPPSTAKQGPHDAAAPPLNSEVEAIASAFTGDALAAFTSVPVGVS